MINGSSLEEFLLMEVVQSSQKPSNCFHVKGKQEGQERL